MQGLLLSKKTARISLTLGFKEGKLHETEDVEMAFYAPWPPVTSHKRASRRMYWTSMTRIIAMILVVANLMLSRHGH